MYIFEQEVYWSSALKLNGYPGVDKNVGSFNVGLVSRVNSSASHITCILPSETSYNLETRNVTIHQMTLVLFIYLFIYLFIIFKIVTGNLEYYLGQCHQ